MSDIVRCFFAYPSKPPALAETISSAISEINRVGGGVVDILDWTKLTIVGKPIIGQICNAIDTCEVFACDLTSLNRNVLFELGYAIAKKKCIWITIDPSIKSTLQVFKQFGLLTTVGYAEYQNSREISDKFMTDQPFFDLSTPLYDSVIQPVLETSVKPPHLFYLKCEIRTESSMRLSRTLDRSNMILRTDDPKEISSQQLAWYFQNISPAVGIVAQLTADNHDTSGVQNAKYSLVCGIAYAFKKSILMLAHAPFEAPVDYHDLLKIHETPTECANFAEDWLHTVGEIYRVREYDYVASQTQISLPDALLKVNLGDPIAENERPEELAEYFVETEEYNEALRSQGAMIFIGRKGTGKTANLLRLRQQLESRRDNHVCVIRVPDYELEGIRRLFGKSRASAEPGYLAESLWKFLLYSELARSVYHRIHDSLRYGYKNPDDKEFMDYVEQNINFIDYELTVRMEQVIDGLCGVGHQGLILDQRVRISEILHSEIITPLRRLLGNVLSGSNKVVILVDNLDKAWSKGNDLDALSDFLFGLLGVSRQISAYFNEKGAQWKAVRLSVVIFLRSDIFEYIASHAREKDKLEVKRMNWNDPQLLERIIEERFASSLGEPISAEEIWSRFFVRSIRGIPIRDYLMSRIIPRPRDIIYLCRAAREAAINRKHTIIEESDIYIAEDRYSQNAVESLIVEASTQMDHFEELLYEFVGQNEIISREEIIRFIRKVGIPENRTDEAISLLCDSTFLGLETGLGDFSFLYDESKKQVRTAQARMIAEDTGKQRFKVNAAFQRYFEVLPE